VVGKAFGMSEQGRGRMPAITPVSLEHGDLHAMAAVPPGFVGVNGLKVQSQNLYRAFDAEYGGNL